MASAQFTFRVNNSSKGHSAGAKSRGTGMFCSVCKKAGKSEAEYTSHFVRENRDPNSRVVCPILLATECRYCKGIGHTKSHCPILKRRNEQRSMQKESKFVFQPQRKQATIADAVKTDTRTVQSEQAQQWVKKHSQSTHKSVLSTTQSRFAALDMDHDKSKSQTAVREEFPSIGVSVSSTAPLPYGKMIQRTATKEATPSEKKEKSVTFCLPKIEKVTPQQEVTPEKEVTFDFIDDYLDWADEAEKTQDDGNVEIPEWAKSQSDDEKESKKKQAIQESVAQLQFEMCDGWE